MSVLTRLKRYLATLVAGALLFALPGSPRVQAGNEHEHLTYLNSYDELLAVLGSELRQSPADEMLRGDRMLRLFGEEVTERFLGRPLPRSVKGGIQINVLSDQMKEMLQNKTFTEAVDRLHQVWPASPAGKPSKDLVGRSFFELTELNRAQPKAAYVAVSEVRGTLLRKQPQRILKALKYHLSHQAPSQTLKTGFSVGLNELEGLPLSEIKALYKNSGKQVQIFFSIPRRFLLKPLDLNATALEVVYGKGNLDGIDISGSLLEGLTADAEIKPAALETYKNNLKTVMKVAKTNNYILRIHAFEGTNQGSFYSAFWQAIREVENEGTIPRQIRIGHVQALDAGDLDRLEKSPARNRFVFEANLESNAVLQSSAEDLRVMKNIRMLHERGYRVYLGADGLGILGDSASFSATLKRLKKMGLPNSNLERLIKDAFIPTTGTRIPKAQLLAWQKEREIIRKEILGSDFKPNLRSPAYLGPCSVDEVPHAAAALLR